MPKSAPLVVADDLYFGTDSGTFYCLGLDDGVPKWSYDIPDCGRKGIWSSPTSHDDFVYFGAYNGNFYCLERRTGQVVWQQPLCEWIGSSPVISPKLGLLFVGLEYERPRAKGSVVALDLATGEKRWEKLLNQFQHGSGALNEKEDTIIFGTNDHNVMSLGASDGKLNWVFETKRSVKYAPTIDDAAGTVVFSSFDGGIYCVALHSGELIHKTQTGNICYTTPLVHGGRIYAGSGDKHFYVIDQKSGELLVRKNCRARIYSNPILHQEAIHFGTSGGIIYSLDEKHWSFPQLLRFLILLRTMCRFTTIN